MFIYSILPSYRGFSKPTSDTEMAQINLKLDSEQLAKTDYLAGCRSTTRTSYIREAIAQYNAIIEREVLARKFLDASMKCRGENLKVNREMEAAEFDIEEERASQH
jgi:predicted transcriptional regulator